MDFYLIHVMIPILAIKTIVHIMECGSHSSTTSSSDYSSYDSLPMEINLQIQNNTQYTIMYYAYIKAGYYTPLTLAEQNRGQNARVS